MLAESTAELLSDRHRPYHVQLAATCLITLLQGPLTRPDPQENGSVRDLTRKHDSFGREKLWSCYHIQMNVVLLPGLDFYYMTHEQKSFTLNIVM